MSLFVFGSLLTPGHEVFAADGDTACFTVVGMDGAPTPRSGVIFEGGVFLRFESEDHFTKDADLPTYAQNVVDYVIGSGWASAPGGGGGSGLLEAERVGTIVKFTLVDSSSYTSIGTYDSGNNTSTDFDPFQDGIAFAAGDCAAGGGGGGGGGSATGTDPTISATDANTLPGKVIDLIKSFWFSNALAATAICLLILLALTFRIIRALRR